MEKSNAFQLEVGIHSLKQYTSRLYTSTKLISKTYISNTNTHTMYLQVVFVVEVVTAGIQGRAAVDLGEDSWGMPPSLEDAD